MHVWQEAYVYTAGSNKSIDAYCIYPACVCAHKDPAVNEFYEELFEHWRPKAKPVLIDLEKEDDSDNGMDLSGLFSVKGEEEEEESGGNENSYALMDPYFTQMMPDDELLLALGSEPIETGEGEGVHAEQGKHEDKVECDGLEKPLDPPGAVGVEGKSPAKPHVEQPEPVGCISTTPKASVTKVPFTPAKEISNKDLDEKIASLKQLAHIMFRQKSFLCCKGEPSPNKSSGNTWQWSLY